MANRFLLCPADCDEGLQLGPLDDVQDCTDYPLYESQICDLIIMPNTATTNPFTWADASPYECVVDLEQIVNSSIDGLFSKKFSGIGGVPDPELIRANYPKKKSKVTGRTYTLTFDVLNVTDDQYFTLRQLQCGWTGFHFWFVTLGGFIFGGEFGIEPKDVDATFPHDAADGAYDKCTVKIIWEADGDPDRNHTPF
jgi:hypothetical protein